MSGHIELPPIPAPDRPEWLDPFLRTHPEARARIEDAEQRGAEERAVAYAVVCAIYEHHATGSPSRWGLIVLLRAFASLLDENDAASMHSGDSRE